MPAVCDTRDELRTLQGIWNNLSVLSRLSETQIQLEDVRSAFGELSSRMIVQLSLASLQRCEADLRAKAQVAADILVRNLFERTADIGFLATDADICRFAACDEATQETTRGAIVRRLRDYQRKYTVYEDIVLLDPSGRVLARMNEHIAQERSTDALVHETLATSAGYLETWRESDLAPGRPSLLYSCAVNADSTGAPTGVLVLVFRLEDECRRIFEGLGGENWQLLSLLTAEGAAVASSDPLVLPGTARLDVRPDGVVSIVRHGGRRWLAVNCVPAAYQGYAGPGWVGHAMIPLELAFDDVGLSPRQSLALDARTHAALMSSPQLFAPALLEIPRIARDIERSLTRAVWNGDVSLAGATEGADGRLSKGLLREIGATGVRTREVFTRAINEMNQTVLASSIDGLRSRSSLAMDIMDRNLYERACDCRWWAQTTAFRVGLSAAPASDDAGEMVRILQSIHALYTVYRNLLLFDREGRVVAASVDQDAWQGTQLDAPWVARTLRLASAEAYVVSDFETTALYDDRPTYVFAAAVHGLGAHGAAVGGIAIVFDSAPQFQAMLSDTLPDSDDGQAGEGAIGLFIDHHDRVIGSTWEGLEPGMQAPAELLASPPCGTVRMGGDLYAYGRAHSAGYREFKGRQDTYREDVRALVLLKVAEGANLDRWVDDAPAPLLVLAEPSVSEGPCVDLAMFHVGGELYALESSEVAEAVAHNAVVALPRSRSSTIGALVRDDEAIPVLCLRQLLGKPAVSEAGPLIVIHATGQRRGFALRVDGLLGCPPVPSSRMAALGQGLVRAVIRPDRNAPLGSMAQVLCVERLADCIGRTTGRCLRSMAR